MLAAYLLEPQRAHLRARSSSPRTRGIGLADEPARGGREDGQLRAGAWRRRRPRRRPRKRRWSLALAEAQRPRLEELGLESLLRDIELPLVHVLAAMERAGLRLDAERLAEVGAGFGERIANLEDEIHELAGEKFTIGSPQQVGRVLFEKLSLTRKRRGKTGLFDRCTRPRADPRGAPDRRENRVLARADEAEEHLPGRPARPDRPRRPAASTRPSTRLPRPPGASRAPTRTCRTSRSGPISGARFAPASWPMRAPACSRPTTARSSCGCSPTWPTRRC